MTAERIHGRFVAHNHSVTSIQERFLSRDRFIILTDGCWEWQFSKNADGYGVFYPKEQSVLAHRYSYELFKGVIPLGLQLDHLCRNHGCINPDHLEAVTSRENSRRGVRSPRQNGGYQLAKTHCPQGHPYDAANTYRYGRHRACKICRREQLRNSRLRRRNGGN